MPVFQLLLGSAPTAEPQGAAGRVRFEDVAFQSGLREANVSGGPDKTHILETTGAGACWLDHDRDGDLDLYLVNGSTLDTPPGENRAVNSLYRNDAGIFIDVASESKVADAGWGGGCSVGDYDNDGDPDLYVTNAGPNVLYRNEGDGTFEDVTSAAGVAGREWSLGSTFLDIDADGDLDLYVANYLKFEPSLAGNVAAECHWKGTPVMCGPRGFPGEPDTLYRNEGDGTFRDVSSNAGLFARALYGMGVVAGDVDADGDTDLFVANDSQENELLLNDGRGVFTDAALPAGVALSGDGRQQASMGADMGDFDGDGDEDLLVTNFSDDYHTLYRNEGDALFVDVTARAGLAAATRASLGWAAAFLDADNDADPDIFIAGGHVYPQVDTSDPATSYRQKNLLFLNRADGTFADVTEDSGPGLLVEKSSRGAAVADYDDDGDPDIVVVNENDTPTLLRNDTDDSGAWIKILLIGGSSNRDGLGTRLVAHAAGRAWTRHLRFSSGYLSSHDPRVHLGLGAASQLDRLEIAWPSGTRQTLTGLPSGRLIIVHEQQGILGRDAPAALARGGAAPASSARGELLREARPANPARWSAPPVPSGEPLSPASLREIDGLVQAGTRGILSGDLKGGIAALEEAIRRLPRQEPSSSSAVEQGIADPDRYRRYVAALYDNLGVGLMRAQRFEECAAAIGEAIRRAPDRGVYHQNLGLCRMHARRHEEAVSSFRDAALLGGAGLSLSYDLGRALALAGRCREAIVELRSALDKLPAVDPEGRHAESWYHIGLCEADEGRAALAGEAFREALWRVPGHQKALYRLASALRAQGLVETARIVIDLFQSRQPEEERARALERAGPRTSAERVGIARIYRDAGLPTEAILEVRKALASAEGDGTTLVLLGELYLALRPPGFEEAEQAFVAALVREPDSQAALAGLGELCRRRGRPEQECAEWLDRSLRKGTGHLQTLVARAWLTHDAGRVEEAILELERVVEAWPNERSARLALAGMYVAGQRPARPRAERALEWIGDEPDLYGEAVRIRARALAAVGHADRATRLIEESPFLGAAARAQLLAEIEAMPFKAGRSLQ